MFIFDTFKGFLILAEFGKLGKFGMNIRQIRQKIWLICHAQLEFQKKPKCLNLCLFVNTLLNTLKLK